MSVGFSNEITLWSHNQIYCIVCKRERSSDRLISPKQNLKNIKYGGNSMTI